MADENQEPPDPCARTDEQIAEDERRSKRAAEIAAGKGDAGAAGKKEPPGAKPKAK